MAGAFKIESCRARLGSSHCWYRTLCPSQKVRKAENNKCGESPCMLFSCGSKVAPITRIYSCLLHIRQNSCLSAVPASVSTCARSTSMLPAPPINPQEQQQQPTWPCEHACWQALLQLLACVSPRALLLRSSTFPHFSA